MPSKEKTLGTALENRLVAKARASGLRARKQPLSGAMSDFPGDVELERLLAECKVRSEVVSARGEKHVPLNLDWLRKVQDQAKQAGYTDGVLVVRAKGSPKPVVVCDLDLFLSLLSRFRDS